jgi:hypothetical protein
MGVAGFTGIALGFAILLGHGRAHRRPTLKVSWCLWMSLNVGSVFVSTGFGLPWDISSDWYQFVLLIVVGMEVVVLFFWIYAR